MRAFLRTIVCSAALLGASGSALGCAHGRPEWVKEGSAEYAGVLKGVGTARGIDDPHLLRTTAENRARLEIVRLLRQEKAKPEVLAATLRGVQIEEVWVQGDTLYALAVYRPRG